MISRETSSLLSHASLALNTLALGSYALGVHTLLGQNLAQRIHHLYILSPLIKCSCILMSTPFSSLNSEKKQN